MNPIRRRTAALFLAAAALAPLARAEAAGCPAAGATTPLTVGTVAPVEPGGAHAFAVELGAHEGVIVDLASLARKSAASDDDDDSAGRPAVHELKLCNGKGNLLVTVPERFLAYAIAPDGTVREFGTAGSAPGKFGVVGAITGDREGNVLVADKQRSVVLCFDAALEFVGEFGGYGDQPESLVRPTAIQFASNDRLVVGQLANRGVSVFRVVRPSGVAP